MKFEILVIIWMTVSINSYRMRTKKIEKTCKLSDFFHAIRVCDITDQISMQNNQCHQIKAASSSNPHIFLFYDVNSMEGFNLRRDVYIRMAVFLKTFREHSIYKNVFLVLPPFYELYHWKLSEPQQLRQLNKNIDKIVFWNHFFDLASLKKFVNVIDIWEYFDLRTNCFGMARGSHYILDHVFKLKHFESMFASGIFEEKFETYDNCDMEKNRSGNQFINLYKNFSIANFHCTEFQGSASLLTNLLNRYLKIISQSTYSIAFLNAETVLHDHWGDAQFWRARRSMRFSKHLVEAASVFRKSMLNSTNEWDNIYRPDDWQHESKNRMAYGGNYLCAHLRRADFLHGREKTTPSLRAAATQISAKLKKHNLRTVFVSSDCTGQEYHDLKSYLPRYRVIKFKPSSSVEQKSFGAGGIAIIDQIICSHSRYFIGTYESTFTYRIYEEREILGFAENTTFNTFCKSHYENNECDKNPVWPIVY